MEKDINETDRPVRLMHSFWQLEKSIMKQVKQTAIHHDLSIPQFAILVMMQRNKEIAQKKLQERTHYPKSTLSYAIEGLVQEKLIHRTHVEGNRREMNLSLSSEGKALLDKMKVEEKGVHMRFKNDVNSLSEEQFTELLNMHQYLTMFFDSEEIK